MSYGIIWNLQTPFLSFLFVVSLTENHKLCLHIAVTLCSILELSGISVVIDVLLRLLWSFVLSPVIKIWFVDVRQFCSSTAFLLHFYSLSLCRWPVQPRCPFSSFHLMWFYLLNTSECFIILSFRYFIHLFAHKKSEIKRLFDTLHFVLGSSLGLLISLIRCNQILSWKRWVSSICSRFIDQHL